VVAAALLRRVAVAIFQAPPRLSSLWSTWASLAAKEIGQRVFGTVVTGSSIGRYGGYLLSCRGQDSVAVP
jgi:hypothetical protein